MFAPLIFVYSSVTLYKSKMCFKRWAMWRASRRFVPPSSSPPVPSYCLRFSLSQSFFPLFKKKLPSFLPSSRATVSGSKQATRNLSHPKVVYTTPKTRTHTDFHRAAAARHHCLEIWEKRETSRLCYVWALPPPPRVRILGRILFHSVNLGEASFCW